MRKRANMTKPGRMCIRHKVWVARSIPDFSRIFEKLQEDRNRSKGEGKVKIKNEKVKIGKG